MQFLSLHHLPSYDHYQQLIYRSNTIRNQKSKAWDYAP